MSEADAILGGAWQQASLLFRAGQTVEGQPSSDTPRRGLRVPKEFHWPSSLNTKSLELCPGVTGKDLWGRCLGLLSARGLRLLRQSCSHVSEPHIGVLRHGL
jgi:hypothetical protein